MIKIALTSAFGFTGLVIAAVIDYIALAVFYKRELDFPLALYIRVSDATITMRVVITVIFWLVAVLGATVVAFTDMKETITPTEFASGLKSISDTALYGWLFWMTLNFAYKLYYGYIHKPKYGFLWFEKSVSKLYARPIYFLDHLVVVKKD